jgi:Peptidase of plants and bacteria
VSQLSISSLRYVMDPTVQLVPAAVPDGEPAFRPQVFEYLQITGTTQHPVSNALEQTFVEHDHRWLVGAETTSKDNESFDSAQERPWFGVPIVAERRGAMTVLVDQARRSTLGPLTTAIHDHILFDSERLGVPPSFEILVDATSNGNATTFSSLSKEQAAAVTFPLFEADPKDTSSFRALAGHAIKINPHEAGSYAGDTGLLRHELTHFLLHEYNSTSPKWLVEGIATYLQYYPDVFSSQRVTPGFYHRLMSADRELPTVGLFNDDPDVNYQIAQAATAWLVSHYGMPKLLELMRAYRSQNEGVDTDALTPRMLRLVDGVSEQQVVAGAFALLASYQH